jgi:glutathione S-transferase
MPLEPQAETVVSALRNTPAFTHGLVRDLRVRWALEEIGRPYRTELFEGMTPRPDDYLRWQPFGQVPAFDDGKVRLFETGAILLHLGEQDERLLPRAPQARADAVSWLIAALNSVEPYFMQLMWAEVFKSGEAWSKDAVPGMRDMVRRRLDQLDAALGNDAWFAGGFSIADIAMVTVLRELDHTGLLDDYPKLAGYKARSEARPAFVRALTDQIADLGEPIQLGEPA